MNMQELKNLIYQGEKVDIECKKAEKSVPKSAYESYSAFANTKGGYIILGVREDKTKTDPKELIEDTNLDQVTLVMKMEKESDDNSAEKSAESAENSADLKNREGMALSERHQQILAIMEAGIEYSTEQVAEKIGLKGPRTRQLLNELVNKELLACIGTTKRRRYIKPVD